MGAGIGALAGLWVGWRYVRSTSLAAVWAWQGAAVLMLLGAGWWLSQGPPDQAERLQPVQFIAAVFLFCPHMALLGAKRPQDRAWSWIVAALWGILVLPALQVLVLHPGQTITIRDMRGAFLWTLIAIEVLNRLGTRAWPSGLFFAAAQFMLLAEHLPLVRYRIPDGAWPAAAVCWLLGVSWLAWIMARPAQAELEYDRWWRDFRDQFGVLWALRVAERWNAVAAANSWPFRLRWSGFQPLAAADDPARLAAEPTLRQSLVNLLRRFISQSWLAAREA